MGTNDTSHEVIDVLQRRNELVDSIVEKPSDTRSLVDELDVSRSTVDRATDELEDFGVIELEPDGFTPTLVGNLILTAYTDFVESVASIASQEAEDELPWHTDEERQAALQLVAERTDFLACGRTPHDKRDLVDELDYSRSTVNRSIRELEVAELVEWTPDGYTTTALGRRAAEQYRATVATITDILAAKDVLQGLPKQCVIPPALLAGSDIEQSDETAPYRLPTGMRERIETADRLRAILPVLANPRLLDCFHRRVQDGTPLELITNHNLFEALTAEFPGPLSEMAATGPYTTLVADTPPFGLLLTDTDAGTAVTVIVYLEQRSVYGVIHNDTDAAIQWAEEHYEHVWMDATDRTDKVQDIAPTGTEARTGTVGLSGVADSERVKREAEGFVQLTPDYFAQRTPAPPATGWRTGFDLVDVHANHAINREYNDDGTRRNLTNELVERLSEGTDQALIGPPGSGKSTVCKSVACRWYEQGKGSVFYRESGTGATFSSPAVLDAHLRAAAAEGHVLVVVEDAVRAEANTIFRVMKSFRGNSSVTFLLDARDGEWDDPAAFPTDAGLEAYRNEAVETKTMPELDETEYERFLRQFEETTDHEFDTKITELLRELRTKTPDAQEQGENEPGELLFFLHRLSLYADPLARYDTQTPTTLTEDIQRIYDEFREQTGLVFDTAILVNLLNAAGIGVSTSLVYALADDDFDDVRDALSTLEGRLLFGYEENTDAYRTVHEEWSALFLDHLCDAASDSEARQRFGRCVTALLSLADNPVLRDRIITELGNDTPAIDRIETEPEEWADTTVENIFHLGKTRPGLVSLFGTTENSTIELPDACSLEMAGKCTKWRARMALYAGNATEAEREYERLNDLAADIETKKPELAARLQGRRLNGLGMVARRQGESDTAEEYYTQALSHYRESGDTMRVADSRYNIGTLAYLRGDLDTAETCLTQSLETYRDLGNIRDEADGLFNLAHVVYENGDLETAIEYYRDCLDKYREGGNRREEADGMNDLGEGLMDRGNLTVAEEYCTQALEIYRDLGISEREANSLNNLGTISYIRGDFATAEKYLKKSLDIRHEIDQKRNVAWSLVGLGDVARKRNQLTTAEDRYRKSLDIQREIGDAISEAHCLDRLGRLAHKRKNLDIATEYAEQSLNLRQETGHLRGKAASLRLLGMVARNQGEIETANDHLTRALEIFRDTGHRYEEAKTLAELGALAQHQDDRERAREWFGKAVILYYDINAVRDVIDGLVSLSVVCETASKSGVAINHCETAKRLTQEADFDLEKERTTLDERYERLMSQLN